MNEKVKLGCGSFLTAPAAMCLPNDTMIPRTIPRTLSYNKSPSFPKLFLVSYLVTAKRKVTPSTGKGSQPIRGQGELSGGRSHRGRVRRMKWEWSPTEHALLVSKEATADMETGLLGKGVLEKTRATA